MSLLFRRARGNENDLAKRIGGQLTGLAGLVPSAFVFHFKGFTVNSMRKTGEPFHEGNRKPGKEGKSPEVG